MGLLEVKRKPVIHKGRASLRHKTDTSLHPGLQAWGVRLAHLDPKRFGASTHACAVRLPTSQQCQQTSSVLRLGCDVKLKANEGQLDGGMEPAVPDDYLLDAATKADIAKRANVVAEVRTGVDFEDRAMLQRAGEAK
eukprot:scaffold66353_cov17-Tisochrysis_lutea.AAC.1